MAVSKGRVGISPETLVNKGAELLSHQPSDAFAFVFNTDNSPCPAKDKTNITPRLSEPEETPSPTQTQL